LFIVQPYLKASTIRSPLGFMSLATYWAQLLFPGITVLTRDFRHVELLHRELRRHKTVGVPREKIDEALRSPALHKRLEKEYRQRVGRETDAAITKVTYWQRYRSLFDYFGLWNAPRLLRRTELWALVFAPRVPAEFRSWAVAEKADHRRRRISHTRWYLRFRNGLREANGRVGPAVLWWVTGEGGPRDASEEIRLSRRLSYAFLIWQTLFEVGAKLRHGGHALPRASSKPINARETVDLLIIATHGEPGVDVLRRIFSGLLSAHTHQLGHSLPAWQARVERHDWHHTNLTQLYDGMPVKSLAAMPAHTLFGRLVALHERYCQAQGKTDAEFVRAVAGRFEPVRMAKVSASFGSPPWGLFGYRLDQAAVLHQSRVAR
jgi:hypothetical protein